MKTLHGGFSTTHELNKDAVYQTIILSAIINPKKITKGYFEIDLYYLYCYSDIFDYFVTDSSEIHLFGKSHYLDMFKKTNNKISSNVLCEVNKTVKNNGSPWSIPSGVQMNIC